MWVLWMMRNKWRHGELSMPIHQAVIWARDMAFDLWQLNHKDEVVERTVKRWKKPLQGCLKINTDAAFYDESKQGATSCVIRDHSGAFYAAQAKWYDKGFAACSMEALACKDSLIFAGQLGVQNMAMETDCLQLVQLWNKRDSQRSINDSTLKEIAELSLAFQSFTLSFVSRLCNKVAHSLAKKCQRRIAQRCGM
jgi:ribonuclease HI